DQCEIACLRLLRAQHGGLERLQFLYSVLNEPTAILQGCPKLIEPLSRGGRQLVLVAALVDVHLEFADEFLESFFSVFEVIQHFGIGNVGAQQIEVLSCLLKMLERQVVEAQLIVNVADLLVDGRVLGFEIQVGRKGSCNLNLPYGGAQTLREA